MLIEDYITPLIGDVQPVFTGLLTAITIIAAIYAIGVLSTLVYTRTMVVIGQGIMKKIQDQMFARMQKLPIGYFDSHTFSNVMRITLTTRTLCGR